MSMYFDMVGIFVSDIEQMVSFYRDVLGLKTNWKMGEPYAEFMHDGVRFSMYKRSELPNILGTTPSYPAGMNGSFELAIDLPDVEDVDREFLRLLNCGARAVYAPREEPWGMYSSMIMDPEGNLLEIGSWKKGKLPEFQLGGVTIPVSSVMESRKFYHDVLGFEEDKIYEPTRWISYKAIGNTFFAIEEVHDFNAGKSESVIDFYLENVEEFWLKVNKKVDIVSPLERTPWGSYKFVIKDRDGNKLGFVKKENV